MTRENDIVPYQGNLPAQMTRSLELEFNRQMERILAVGAIGMTGMDAMSEVERHAAFKVAITAAAAELLVQGANVTRPYGAMTPAEREAQQRLFEAYTHHIGQLAAMTDIKILQAVDRATEQLGERTFADVVEDFGARLVDAFAGSPSLPSGRR